MTIRINCEERNVGCSAIGNEATEAFGEVIPKRFHVIKNVLVFRFITFLPRRWFLPLEFPHTTTAAVYHDLAVIRLNAVLRKLPPKVSIAAPKIQKSFESLGCFSFG